MINIIYNKYLLYVVVCYPKYCHRIYLLDIARLKNLYSDKFIECSISNKYELETVHI